MGIEEVQIAPRQSLAESILRAGHWQHPSRVLDDVIVLNERHLYRVLQSYMDYYHIGVHRSLEMDAPKPRPVQPPELGSVRKLPEVGGLHHHYERMAA